MHTVSLAVRLVSQWEADVEFNCLGHRSHRNILMHALPVEFPGNILRETFGFSSVKPGQTEAVTALLAGRCSSDPSDGRWQACVIS